MSGEYCYRMRSELQDWNGFLHEKWCQSWLVNIPGLESSVTDIVIIGVAFKDIRGDKLLYPCVGIKKQTEYCKVNFGQTPFVFDIESLFRVSTCSSSLLQAVLTTRHRSKKPT